MRELTQWIDDTNLEIEDIVVEFARSYEELLNAEVEDLNREEVHKEQESILIAMAILQTQWRRLEDRLQTMSYAAAVPCPHTGP